jgi:hypothetical protein
MMIQAAGLSRDRRMMRPREAPRYFEWVMATSSLPAVKWIIAM